MSQAGSLGGGIIPPGGVVETLTGNSGGAVGPNGSGNINVLGDGTSIDVAGNPGINTLTISVTDAVATQYDTDSGSAVPIANVLNVNGGVGVITSGATNVVTISQSPERILNNYSVANASPYVVQADDYYITVDTSTIPITIQLPNAPTAYQVFIIKDSAGNAATQNVTVTTVGGILNIDAATTFVMNTDWQSIHVVFDLFGYQVY